MSQVEVNSTRILVLAPIGRDGRTSSDLLRQSGLATELCSTLAEIVDGLRAGAAAAFIAEEGLFNQDISSLAEWVDLQAPWSDLPFVILTSRREHPVIAAWRQRVVTALRNVSLLERPAQVITLTSSLKAAVRARLRQYEIRDLLEARRNAAEQLEALVIARTDELRQANNQLQTQMEERARVEESLRQAQKIEAIGQLTGGVAHDFNNLLMVVLGGLDLMQRKQDLSQRERIIEGMRQAAQRGAGLTRQLLAFSRRQPLLPKPVDLSRQIGGMRELLDGSLRGDVTVQLEFSPDLWPVEVDPGELELVVLNLAVNARDAMPSGGAIILKGENAPGEMIGDRKTDCVCFSVTDFGTGMTPEIQARIFDPFFTTKDVGKGSGLGLPQVHGFATQSGGAVKVESVAGKGTTISLFLPRAARMPAEPDSPLIETRCDKENAVINGAVLLVDDDNEVAALVGEMLEQLGYRVTRAASATAALGALANDRIINLVFSDIMMPGEMNGVDLALEVRKRRPDLPILLTSGYSEAAKEAAESAGIQVLPKPYSIEELASAVSRTIRQSSA